MPSYAPQLQTNRYDMWHGNRLRFTTYEEAMEYVRALRGRWRTAVSDIRVVETNDPVNARWYAGRTEQLEASDVP